MKRWINILSALAFLGVCAGVLMFLLRFTRSEPAFTYPAWETGAVVSAAGTETAFDPLGLPPALEEGERYRFTLTLPPDRGDGVDLLFETAGLEAAVFLDGTELWYSAAQSLEGTVNLSKAQIPLPAGATALALVLLWGLFLLGLAHGKRDFLLLLPILAAALLTVHWLARGYGIYFLPEPVQALLAQPWLEWATALLLALYLALHRERPFWRALGRIAAWSAGALVLAGLISHLRGGYLDLYLSELASQLAGGIWSGTLYWLIWWLVLVCAALSAWELARSIARAQGEARALALKNQLMQENYRAIQGRLRESARRNHAVSHQVTALDAAVQARDWTAVERLVSAWKEERAADHTHFTENVTVNAILQDAAGRAKAAGIAFHASVLIPKTLPMQDGELCALLMNMLDNALEGAQRTPEGREKTIRFQMRVKGDFIPILCENTFDGHVETAPDGSVKTTKADPDSHGFGLAQMRAVVEKYESILDVSWTDDKFTVQTAPQFPREK